MAMSALALFPCPPAAGLVTICEKHGELVTAEASRPQTRLLPDLDVPRELLRSCRSKESARSAFLAHEDSPSKRLLHAWYEQGLTGVLEEMTNDGLYLQSRSRFLSRCAGAILWTVRMANSLHGSLFPHLAMSNEDLIAEFSNNPTWKTGSVRCFAWHPHAPKFAVALQNDCVTVHTVAPLIGGSSLYGGGLLGSSSGGVCESVVPTLKHKMQRGVADLAWKPLSASILAVACQTCVLVWTVDPQSLSTRPPTGAVQVLSAAGHSPVVSLSWSPLQGTLVSASAADNSIMVWDVALGTHQPIRRVGHGGVTFLRWAPDGSKLLTACPSPLFRVWECVSWTCEKWTNQLGRCKDACWSPDGSMLLFATSSDPVLYSLTFDTHASACMTRGTAVGVIGVSAVDKATSDGACVRVGGLIQAMAWDSNGERLAIVFEGSAAACVALFQTRLKPYLEVLPCGFIRGQADELATIVSFKRNYTEGGALLTVVWSSGRVSHVPLLYTPRCDVGRHTNFDVDPQVQRFSRLSQ